MQPLPRTIGKILTIKIIKYVCLLLNCIAVMPAKLPKQRLCQRKVVSVLIKQHATKNGGVPPHNPNLAASGGVKVTFLLCQL
jgi:hypothetical protein